MCCPGQLYTCHNRVPIKKTMKAQHYNGHVVVEMAGLEELTTLGKRFFRVTKLDPESQGE
jgi:hypothetical protein